MLSKFIYYYDTEIGRIGIADNGKEITNLFFNNSSVSPAELKETPNIKEAAQQLKEYFSGKRQIFTFKIKPEGTEFQMKVWAELQRIPFGETRTYREIAERIGNDKACRAVGLANNRNPIAIIIPCHRVIGANKSLTGYAGGLDVKEKLLKMESPEKMLF